MMKRINPILTFTIVAAGLLAPVCNLHGQSVLARAEAEPSVFTVGEVSTYSIHFLNTDSIPRLVTPRVDGLEFSGTPSTSSLRRIENGRFSLETTMSWSFRATRLGSFIIPGRPVTIKGEELNIPDVEIRVIEQTEEQKSRAYLILELPDGPYYVGQSLKSRLILLGRNDLHLSPVRLPECENDLFQHTELNSSQQRGSLDYKGRSYNAIVWNIIITPIKTGITELKFRQDLELQTVSRDSRFPSIFSMTSTQSEPLTIYSDNQQMEILPLPEKPSGSTFSGGIGTFDVSVTLGSKTLTQGEPTTFTLALSGEGNFERIAPPDLPQWDNWRIYPPKVSFEEEETTGFKGSKSFEYILIPQSDALAEVPAFSYATFDPAKGDYVVTELGAIPVAVEASELSSAIDTFIPDPDNPGLQERVPEKLLSLRPELGRVYPAGSILWKDPVFWSMNAVVAMILASGAMLLRRRKRLRTDSRLARQYSGNRKVRKALQAAQQAVRENNPQNFHQHARFAIQESISHLSREPLESKSMVTMDCLRVLSEASVPVEVTEMVEKLLGRADAFQFAGLPTPEHELASLHKALISLITHLSRAKK